LGRLVKQLQAQKLCLEKPKVTLCLAAGKVRNQPDHAEIQSHFDERGWLFMGPGWIKEQLASLVQSGYENSITAVTAKVLLRDSTSN
ncbi:MAG: hypothetical protein ABIP48_29590, partial [Planctomycetota bacterium]